MRTLNPCSARTIAALLLAFAVGGEAFAQALTPIDQVVATPGAVTGEIGGGKPLQGLDPID